MDTEIVKFIGYHGTSNDGEKSILRNRIYKVSNKENEWLGSGIYFFIDKNKETAIKNAYKWAVNYKKFNFYSVLETTASTNKDKVMDLNNDDWQYLYHKYREERINYTINKGITIETDKIKFDCEVINDICKKFDIDIVYQQRYINLGSRRNVVSSEVPNCKIMCVRRNDIINRRSIRAVERGVKR
ncbi:hypothetical protein [Clostridium tertium]|uniref:hypothetical protein n=1 Tax=Clostridium tertium TaxID=1559 RepID=UPI002A833669|nr:hypothetical protein [Clostridium tertium]MDY4604007.1 hypothetical protein [Clostridium tertium]